MNNLKCKVLVLGIGNLLMSDDGLGVYVAQWLKQENWPQEVSILEVGTSVLNYIDEISCSCYVIVIDAVRGGERPGSIYCHRDDKIMQYVLDRQDAHSFSVLQAVELARELTGYPVKLIIYGMEPMHINYGQGLSPLVIKALPMLVNQVIKEIKSYNSDRTIRDC